MPSTRETFGIVYIEAISQGVPIIYKKNDGVFGFFEEGKVGYGVNPDDEKSILNAIELIRNNYFEIHKNCITYSKYFSWEKQCNMLLKEYLR